jgi:hypothetical protein
MNKFTLILTTIIATGLIDLSIAQPLEQTSSYIPETSKLINQTTVQATNAIRKVQKTDDLLIPKDWKLVSVAPIFKLGSNEQEFMLFFQDSKSNIHSLGVTSGGMVTGRNILKIKASE